MLLTKRLNQTNVILNYHKPIFMSWHSFAVFASASVWDCSCQIQKTWHLNLIYVMRQHEFGSSFCKYALTLDTIAETAVDDFGSGFALKPIAGARQTVLLESKKWAYERWRWQLWSMPKVLLLLWQWILIGIIFPRYSTDLQIIDTRNPFLYPNLFLIMSPAHGLCLVYFFESSFGPSIQVYAMSACTWVSAGCRLESKEINLICNLKETEAQTNGIN